MFSMVIFMQLKWSMGSLPDMGEMHFWGPERWVTHQLLRFGWVLLVSRVVGGLGVGQVFWQGEFGKYFYYSYFTLV